MIVLDTQIVFWLAQVPDMISDDASAAIHEQRFRSEPVAISDKTLWELAMMLQRGFVTSKTSTREFLLEVERYFKVLPITPSIAERAVLFSRAFPKDPSDRIIAATALVHGVHLITADEKIRASGEVPCIW